MSFKAAIDELYDGFAEEVVGPDVKEEALIVLASIIGPVFANERAIASELGLPLDFVIQIGQRLRRSGHWDGEHIPKFHYDLVANNENGLESNICFALMVLVAAGRMYAQRSGDDFLYSNNPFPAPAQVVHDENCSAQESPMNAPVFAWTDERVELLKTLWADNKLLAAEIAERLGAPTRNVVLGKVYRLGLSRPRPAPKPKPPARPRRANSPRPIMFRAAPPVVPASPTEPPGAYRRGLLELCNESCRWPVSGDGPPFEFCGAPEANLSKGSPYCSAHRRIAYRRHGEAA